MGREATPDHSSATPDRPAAPDSPGGLTGQVGSGTPYTGDGLGVRDDSPASESVSRANASRAVQQSRPNRSKPRERRHGGWAGAIRETAIVVVLSLVIATLVRIFLVQAFLIPSQSMEDTLLVGDRVLVNKLTPRFGEIKRGDVVVFADPGGWLGPELPQSNDSGPVAALREALEFVGVLPSDAEGHLIKRVVGVGGDTIACCDKEGKLTVNGVSVEEGAYLYRGDSPSNREFEEKVPQGELFVMGDHRSFSSDSRVNGFVPESKVTGRAFIVVWPLDRWHLLKRPGNFSAVPGS